MASLVPDPARFARAKPKLLEAVAERLRADLEALTRQQRAVQAGATHEESRAEHAKDTRATEQGYLARGLAERVGDLERRLELVSSLAPADFAPDDPIAPTALVWLQDEQEDDVQLYFVLPGIGGVRLVHDGQPLGTLSAASPLGRALLGLQRGDAGRFASPRGEREFEVLAVA